jgi:hypothetical protein
LLLERKNGAMIAAFASVVRHSDWCLCAAARARVTF